MDEEEKSVIHEETFCFPRPFETVGGLIRAHHPVDAAIDWFNEYTERCWENSQAINWAIRYKCWKLNFRDVTDWAARLLFLDTMNIERERGLTSKEWGEYMVEGGIVPTFWEPHKKQKVPNIIGDLEYLLLNMKRLFPGKYQHCAQKDVCELIGKRWRMKELGTQFLWQEYGESYKDCLRKLKSDGPGQTKSSLLGKEGKKENKLCSGEYVIQLLICSSVSDQIYLMLRVTTISFGRYKIETLNVCHYPLDKGDGTKWLYYTDSIRMRYGRWNVIEETTPLSVEL